MREKVNQFISNLNGQFIEVSDATNRFQCMDLAYNWIFALDIPKATIQRLYAFEVYAKANDFTREYFDVIQNTPEAVPESGDIVVWNKTSSNVAGHIGVAVGDGNISKFWVFEQNNPLGTNAHVQERSYTGVLGWLRPKKVIIEGVPQWFTTLLQERGLTLSNESEIRSIFEKAKKYDDEIKALQDQIKVANEQLADKALEVSDLIGKNEALTTKNEELEKLYNDAKSSRDTLSWEKEKLALLVDKITGEKAELQKGIDTRETTITGLRDEVARLEKASAEDLSVATLIKFIFDRIFGRK